MTVKYLKQIAPAAFLVIFTIVFLGFSHPARINNGKVLSATTGTSTLVSVNSTTTPDSFEIQVRSLIQENIDSKNKIQQMLLEASVRRVLKRGVSGQDVLAVQKLLQQALGDEGLSSSGYFGKTTEKAVRAFQEQESLTVTGIVDQETLAHLSSTINDQSPLDTSQYDDLAQQLNDLANICSLASVAPYAGQSSSTPRDTTSSDASALTPPDTNSLPPGVCPVGCISQDQIPECPVLVPDTTLPPSPAPAPVPAPSPAPASTTTPPQAASSTPPSATTSTPLSISNILSSVITASGANITWNTSASSDSQVDYGKTTSYGQATALNGALVTSHSMTLSGLASSTLYHFRVKSKSASGQLATSADQTFTTMAPPDTTPPQISNIQTSNATSSAVTIGWTTNENSDTQVEYGKTTSYGQVTALNGALVTSHSAPLSGLSPVTQYHFRVKSKDAAGNLATSNDQVFTTTK